MGAQCQGLPAELIHNVFENLDKPSLATCSLASHNLMELARPYLFRSIIWTFIPPPPSRGAPARYHPTERFPLLADFLESQPTIASYIRNVQLSMIGDGTFDGFEVFLRILRFLPGLHALTLVGIPGDEGEGYVFSDPRESVDLPLVPSLHSLQFKDTLMRKPNDINYILSLFGSIEHLIFADYYGHPKEDDSVSDLPYPRLGLLELHDHFAFTDLILWIQPRQIHRLKLPLPSSPGGLDVLQNCFTKLGASLQHMHFSVVAGETFYERRNEQAQQAQQAFFDLSSATSLESIVLPLLLSHTDPGEPEGGTTLIYYDTYSAIVAMLRSAARSLRTVTLELYTAFLADSWEHSKNAVREDLVIIKTEALLWELGHLKELEEVCSQMALHTLEIRTASTGQVLEGERRRFEEALPRLLARGVLRFSQTPQAPRMQVHHSRRAW